MAARACGRSRRCRTRTPMVRVLHAQRGSLPEDMPLDAFIARCEPYFGWGGCIIDQPFQPRLPDGMIRCYMSGAEVAGFGHQLIKALIPPPPEGPDVTRGAAGPTHHARTRCTAIPGAATSDGGRMDAADDGAAGHRRSVAAGDLGRRLPVRAPRRAPAPTPTSCARSTRARASRFPTRRRRQSPER